MKSNIDDVGKIVTFMTVGGSEYVGKLLSLDNDNRRVFIGNPQQVVIQEGNLGLAQPLITAKIESDWLDFDQVLWMVPTDEEVASEYED